MAVGRVARQPGGERLAVVEAVCDVEVDDVTDGERESLRAGDASDVDDTDRQVVWQMFELANELPDRQHEDPLPWRLLLRSASARGRTPSDSPEFNRWVFPVSGSRHPLFGCGASK